ncbi:MAG: hypothetical protein D9V44_03610 [Actinobacteria bacterium]|nr:MAG: hypothetical protein D9V44_03610 [Actinomycetota bacterium]
MHPTRSGRLLFIAHEFPPSAGGGVQRLTKFARYLGEMGWDIQVLSATPVPGRPRDETLLGEVDGIRVFRRPARHIAGYIAGVLRPLKRMKAVVPGAAAAGASSGTPGAAEGRGPLSGRISRWLAVPDDAVLWARDIPVVAARMHREAPFAAIVASGPPYSALVGAVRAGERLQVPVIADLRDPWSGNLHAVWPTTWHQRRFHALEREVMERVAGVTAVSEVIAAEAIAYGAKRAEVIPNGFDAADMPAWSPDTSAPLRIAFLGQFSPGVADPAGFFAGVAAARGSEPLLADLRIDVVGPAAPWAVESAHRVGLGDAVVFHGFKPYAEALRVIAAADAGLIVLADSPGSKGVYSGKLFDYVGIGIPILLYGPPEGAAADVVRATGCGAVVRYGDLAQVEAAVIALAREKASGGVQCQSSQAVRATYDRREQVRVLSRMIEDVITAR